MVMSKRRLKINTGACHYSSTPNEEGRVDVLVPQDGTVADACAAAETSGRVGNRRIHTFVLTDCELITADSISDAVEDGEELRPVFEEAGAGSTAESCAGEATDETSEVDGQGRDAKQSELGLELPLPSPPSPPPRQRRGRSEHEQQRHLARSTEIEQRLEQQQQKERGCSTRQTGYADEHLVVADPALYAARPHPPPLLAQNYVVLSQSPDEDDDSPDEDDNESEDEMKSLHKTHFSSRLSPPPPSFPSSLLQQQAVAEERVRAAKEEMEKVFSALQRAEEVLSALQRARQEIASREAETEALIAAARDEMSSYSSLSSAPPAIQHPLGEEGATLDDSAAERAPARGAHTEPVEHKGLDIAELQAAMTKKSAAQEPLLEYVSNMSVATPGAEWQPSEVGSYIRYTGIDFAADDDCQGETLYW
jgi:hypothetical protein